VGRLGQCSVGGGSHATGKYNPQEGIADTGCLVVFQIPAE